MNDGKQKDSRFSRLGMVVLAGLVVALVGVGCPTIRTEHKIDAHIVIDVRKIEAQAGQIEEEVRTAPKASPDGEPSAMVAERETDAAVARVAPAARRSPFDIASAAYADEASDEVIAIRRRKARAGKISTALTEGCLGENAAGYVSLRPCKENRDSVAKRRTQELADEENADRKIVYEAFAVREGLQKSQAGLIGEIFAGQIRKRLKSGQQFQVPTSGERYQEFRDSDLGKALPNAGKGDWVARP